MSEREGEGDRRKKGLKREGVRGGPREERGSEGARGRGCDGVGGGGR